MKHLRPFLAVRPEGAKAGGHSYLSGSEVGVGY